MSTDTQESAGTEQATAKPGRPAKATKATKTTKARAKTVGETAARRKATPTAAPKRRARASAVQAATQSVVSTRQAAGKVKEAASHAGSAAMAVAADLTELVAEASHNTLALNPLVGLRRADLAKAAGALLKVVRKTPKRALGHLGAYSKTLGEVVRGRSQLAPDAKDRRFVDPAWKTNPFYSRLLQGYVATQAELGRFIDESDLSKLDKDRARFFASLVTDALAPSNWLSNPAALRKVLDTGGGSLVKGVQQLLHDMRHNHMMPTQVDARPFRVGETVATSPGQVVLRHEMFELLQFSPTTEQVYRRPLVMSPPQVNKYYAMDLTPEKSLVKWAADSGVQLFVLSWRNPGPEHRHWGIEDYVMALDVAVDAARQITGSPDVNMWGSCSGGMTLAAYLGWLAAQGSAKVANTTWAVCVLDAEAAIGDSTLGLFNTPETIRAAKARSRRKGYVGGDEMAAMFAWLRPNDLIWNYWVNNYLLGNKPPAYDVLAWNADTTRLPGQYHCDLLDIVEKNPYVNPGTLSIAGLPIDLSQVACGAYVIGGITDHITPWRACYGTARLFGPDTTFVLANAGHLQSMINPPGTPKSFFMAKAASEADPMQWAEAAQATRQDGSWWPHWRGWIQARSGEQVAAPRKAGSRKHKPLGKAPGEYVLVR